MIRFIERNLDVEWLLFIIAILLFVLVLKTIFRYTPSEFMHNYIVRKNQEKLDQIQHTLANINSRVASLQFNDKVRQSYFFKDRGIIDSEHNPE